MAWAVPIDNVIPAKLPQGWYWTKGETVTEHGQGRRTIHGHFQHKRWNGAEWSNGDPEYVMLERDQVNEWTEARV